MTPLKLSGILTTLSMILLIVVIYPLSWFLFKYVGHMVSVIFIALAVIFHSLNYILTRFALDFMGGKFGITLSHTDRQIDFDKLSYLKLYLGFVWRMVLLNVVSTSLFESFNLIIGVIPSVIVMGVIIFFAFLWLLRFPYGKVKIKY